jgi:transposase
LDIIDAALVNASRLVAGREAQPTAAIIDSQSVKTTERGGISGFDAAKKVKGRKRHIATDTQGNVLYGIVYCAGIQDRDGAPMVIEPACQNWPTLLCFFADGGYAGWKLALALLQKIDDPPQIEIVRRADTATGFVVIAKRWVVERTFAWLGRCRRLAKDGETSRSASNAWLTIAAIRRQARFIVKPIKSMI